MAVRTNPNVQPAEVSEWVLHQNASSSFKCRPECPHRQQGPVRAAAKAQQEGNIQEDVAGWPLPQTWRAPGQWDGPVGANALRRRPAVIYVNVLKENATAESSLELADWRLRWKLV